MCGPTFLLTDANGKEETLCQTGGSSLKVTVCRIISSKKALFQNSKLVELRLFIVKHKETV